MYVCVRYYACIRCMHSVVLSDISEGIHAREWIGPATATFLIYELTENRRSDNEDLVKKLDWYFVPSVNPDGYAYSRSSDRMWRKTRSVLMATPTATSHNLLLLCATTDLSTKKAAPASVPTATATTSTCGARVAPAPAPASARKRTMDRRLGPRWRPRPSGTLSCLSKIPSSSSAMFIHMGS